MNQSTEPGAAPRRRIAAVLRLPFALLLALPSVGCPPSDPCTPAPPRPANAAVSEAEWQAAVHPNCFSNQLRIGRWFGRDVAVAAKESPAQYYIPVGENGITTGSVAVLIHGWAPGFRTAVSNAGGNLQWWENGATDSTGVWSSDWAWVPTVGTSTPLSVTKTGVFQEIYTHDPATIVLGYSWIDDSATLEDSYVDLDLVYRSEAYTNVNGLRLAAALETIIDPGFWGKTGNTLHLIGHSHGSKVATVATLALQSRGRPVDHLTILDTPESESTLLAGGANLLGFYLNQIATRGGATGSGTFVDNYVSYFGSAFNGSPNADRVVEVVLNPEIFGCTDAGDRHSYSAAWYGGAAAAAASFSPRLPPIGLDWPPPPSPSEPALNQTWSGGVTARQQWLLTAGQPGSLGCLSSAQACAYLSPPATVALGKTTGYVSGTPATGLTFSAGSTVSTASAALRTSYSSTQYGVAFQVEWTAPTAGDYLVVTADSDEGEEVVLVMDGKSAIAGKNPVSINVDVDTLDFAVYYVPAQGNSAGKVALSGFRRVEISCD